jgi:hypothetical protein
VKIASNFHQRRAWRQRIERTGHVKILALAAGISKLACEEQALSGMRPTVELE